MIEIEKRIVGIDELHELAEAQEDIRHTPHLGGELTGYHWMLLGGIASDVVLVDTASATNDELGGVGSIDGQGFVNGKWSQAPAAAIHKLELNGKKLTQLEQVLGGLGFDSSDFVENIGKATFANLVAIHTRVLTELSADRTHVQTARSFWRVDDETSEAMSQHMAENGMFRRWYDLSAKHTKKADKYNQINELDRKGAYYEGEDVGGMLLTVESLLAMQAVRSALAGRDITFEFLNPESVDYITADHSFERRVLDMAKGTLERLGVTTDMRYCYLVAEDYELMNEIGGSANQFERARSLASLA